MRIAPNFFTAREYLQQAQPKLLAEPYPHSGTLLCLGSARIRFASVRVWFGFTLASGTGCFRPEHGYDFGR
jgi:hypothetical protein